MTKLTAINDIVIVKQDAEETVNSFGLIIPDSFSKKPDQGTVVSVGENVDNDAIQPGKRVLLADASGFEVSVEKDDFLITKEMSLIAVIEDESPGKVGINRLSLIQNNVLFRFLDDTSGTQNRFTDRASASGIIVSARRAEQNNPRWGEVIAVGPNADVNVGDYIFIEGSAWSTKITFAGESFWKTDDDRIIMSTTDIEDTL